MASGGAFHLAYPHASQQAFLEAHEAGFAHFGGVFRVLRYDNLASAVKKILRGHQRDQNERFVGFRSHWGFESEFSNPASGNEKGGVEGDVGYGRRNRLVPVPQVGNWDELNLLLAEGNRRDESRVIEGRSDTIGAAMLVEREHLLPLAGEGFDLAARHNPAVDGGGCVKVLTNFYSAPLEVGTRTEVRVHAGHVEIWHRGPVRGAPPALFRPLPKGAGAGPLPGRAVGEAGGAGGIDGAGAVPGAGEVAGQLRPVLGQAQGEAGQASRDCRDGGGPAAGPGAGAGACAGGCWRWVARR